MTPLPPRRLAQGLRICAAGSVLAVMGLAGCGQPIAPPPIAQTGDGRLMVQLRTASGTMPAGALVVIAIERVAAPGVALAGDQLTLSQADTGVAIGIALDKAAVAACGARGQCQVTATVSRGGAILFRADRPAGYTPSTREVRLRLTRG